MLHSFLMENDRNKKVNPGISHTLSVLSATNLVITRVIVR